MSEQLLAYYRKHRQIVEEKLHASHDAGDVEAIHDFRTSIKRIRVVARLTDHLCDGAFDEQQSLSELNALFRASGKLRDVQVTKYLLNNLHDHDVDPISRIFDQRELKQRYKFEASLQAFPWQVFDRIEERLMETLDTCNASEVKSAAIALLEDYLHIISILFHGDEDEKRMHKIRTKLKDINYLNNIFDEQLPVMDYIYITLDRLRELGELAGLWHDHFNLESKLGKYIAIDSDTLHREALQEIKFRLKEKKEELFQEYCCILVNEMKV